MKVVKMKSETSEEGDRPETNKIKPSGGATIKMRGGAGITRDNALHGDGDSDEEMTHVAPSHRNRLRSVRQEVRSSLEVFLARGRMATEADEHRSTILERIERNAAEDRERVERLHVDVNALLGQQVQMLSLLKGFAGDALGGQPTQVIKEVPVEVIKEVIKEVEVLREVEVVKEVVVIKEVPVETIKEIPGAAAATVDNALATVGADEPLRKDRDGWWSHKNGENQDPDGWWSHKNGVNQNPPDRDPPTAAAPPSVAEFIAAAALSGPAATAAPAAAAGMGSPMWVEIGSYTSMDATPSADETQRSGAAMNAPMDAPPPHRRAVRARPTAAVRFAGDGTAAGSTFSEVQVASMGGTYLAPMRMSDTYSAPDYGPSRPPVPRRAVVASAAASSAAASASDYLPSRSAEGARQQGAVMSGSARRVECRPRRPGMQPRTRAPEAGVAASIVHQYYGSDADE